MRFGILGYTLDDFESLELVQTGRDLGHEASIFVLGDISFGSGRARGSHVVIGDQPAEAFDVIISRAQIRRWQALLDYERYALLSDVPGLTVVDPAEVYLPAESKFLGLQRMAAVGLPIAPTRSCASVHDVRDALAQWECVVLKPSFGLGGVDVERVFDLDAEIGTVERLLADYGELVCQPYYPHPDGDVRVTVVGDRAPLTVTRVPAPPGWKANVNMGASARRIEEPAPELIEMSLRAARAMGVTIAGLDFLPTPAGYRIVEFNNTPSWDFAEARDRRALTEAIYELATTAYESATGPDRGN